MTRAAAFSLLVLARLASGAPAGATATPLLHFDSWTVEDGLPANSISDILQTPDGYLWLGTPNGLVRFDGVRFTVLDRTSDAGVDANRCTALAPDAGNAFWVATDIGVLRCEGERCRAFTGAAGLPRAPVRSLSSDRAGRLWALTDDRLLELAGETFAPVALPPSLGEVHTLRRDNHAGVFRASSGALERFARGALSRWGAADGLPADAIDWIAEDQDGALWVATPSGLSVIRDGVVRGMYGPVEGVTFTRPALDPASRPVAPLLDRSGALWISSPDVWLGRLADGKFEALASPYASPPEVSALFEDRQGNIWIATAGHGLLRARRQLVRVLGAREGIAGDDVSTILEDRRGVLWIGTTRGLSRLEDGRITNFGEADGLPSRRITALHEDRGGRLWVGALGGIRTLSGERFVVPHPELGPGCRECERISALAVDREDTVWVGTDEEGVLTRKRDGTLAILTKKDGLASDTANVIVEDSRGAIWIGGREGLTRVENGAITAFTERDGLPSNRVRAVTEGADGTLWVATYDGGIARRDRGRFTHVSAARGLFSNDVSQVLPDGVGHLWLASNRGIYRVSEPEVVEVSEGRLPALTSRAFGRSDGMRSVVCAGGRWPAGIRTSRGELWFPTRGGVAIIDPASVPTDREPPPVRIEGAVVDQKPVRVDERIRLTPGQSTLEILYTALSLLDSEHLQFLYRLEGIESDWVVAGTRRTAYYAHLPPGRYTFRVQAANADGVRSRESVALPVVVVPPFWRTPLFGVPAGVVGLLAAFLWHRRRLFLVEREKRLQEDFARRLLATQEDERKRIAGELHDSVGQSLAVIKNQALLGLALPDAANVARQLREVAETSSHAIDEVREIAYGLRPHLLERLGLTRTIEALVRKVGDAQGLAVEAELESIDGALSPEAEINVFRIVQESLSNTVKHAEARTLRVATRRTEGRTGELTGVEVTVRDDGRGFATAGAVSANGPRRGFGLLGMTERGRLIGAEVTIASAPGEGTTVTITHGAGPADPRTRPAQATGGD